MIAELHNKISRTGSNLSDRLEDQLTGNFFGAIRYLPFELGLHMVLKALKFADKEQDLQWQQMLDSVNGYRYEMEFWVRHAEGEIDLIITLPDAAIGIEVKYLSGLSSEDEETHEEAAPEESMNQLARYSRLLQDVRGERAGYLVFLAPMRLLLSVSQGMQNRAVITKEVPLGFLAWETVLEQLRLIDLQSVERGQRQILQDLIDLLVHKGFERFNGFGNVCRAGIMGQQAYRFNPQTTSRVKLNWPTNLPIKEESYVYSK